MYDMLAISLSMFKIIMSLNEVKIITIDELTYYEKKTLPTPDGVLPFVSSSPKWITTCIELSLR